MWDEYMLNTGSTGLYAACYKPCDAYDSWSGILLRRSCLKAKYFRNYDAEFCFSRDDNCFMVFSRLFSVLQRRRRRNHRKVGQNVFAWNYSNYYVWKRGNPRTRLCSLPNDVCNHYSSSDYWSICK